MKNGVDTRANNSTLKLNLFQEEALEQPFNISGDQKV